MMRAGHAIIRDHYNMKHLTSCGFLIRSKDKYLLCHPSNLRTGTAAGDRGWGLPKGKLDSPDEDMFDCAVRETKEETTIDLDLPVFESVLTTAGPIYTTEYLTTFQGEQVRKTVNIFYAYEKDGIMQNLILSCPTMVEGTNIPEMDDFRWVTREEALKMVTRSMRDLFENLDTYVRYP